MRKLLVVAILSLIVFGGAAAAAPVNSVNSSVSVTIESTGFVPSSESIDVSDSIGFTNADTVAHEVVFSPPTNINCTPSPVALQPGDSAICYFLVAGSYDFTDPIAGFMGTITVAPCCSAPVFTSAAAATFDVGASSTFLVQSSGVPHATVSEAGALPPGLTFTPQSNGQATISGTATGESGSFPLTFSATNGVSPDATQAFTLTVTGGAPPTTVPVTTTTTTTLPPSLPSRPIIRSAVGGKGKITVTWLAPVNVGTSRVNSYRLGISSCSNLVRCTVRSFGASRTRRSYPIGRLTSDREYWIWISAQTAVGAGPKAEAHAIAR